jgi:hypothetical protein
MASHDLEALEKLFLDTGVRKSSFNQMNRDFYINHEYILIMRIKVLYDQKVNKLKPETFNKINITRKSVVILCMSL